MLLAMVVTALVSGTAARWIVHLVLNFVERLRKGAYSAVTRREIQAAAAVLVATLASWPFYWSISIEPRYQDWLRWVLECMMVLGGVLLAMGMWDAASDAIVARTGERYERAEKLLVPVTRKLMRFVFIVIGMALAMEAVGVNVAGLVAGLGIGGVAIALAAKDSVENIFGSLTVLFDMPFALGDWVRIDKVEGIVEEINLRSTKVRTFEDTLITLPNANLIRASVENCSARRYRRQRFLVRVAQDSSADAIDAFCASLRQYIDDKFGIWPEKTIVELGEIGDHTLGIQVQFFVEASDQLAEAQQRHQVMIEIMRLREEQALKAPHLPIQNPPPSA